MVFVASENMFSLLLFILAIIGVAYIIIAIKLRKAAIDAYSKLSDEDKLGIMNHLHENADNVVKCPKCVLPALYYGPGETGLTFADSQKHQSKLLSRLYIYCLKCDLGMKDITCQTDVNYPENAALIEKKRIAEKASKTLSPKERAVLLLNLHLNSKDALKCPQCDLPSLYYDKVKEWQPYRPNNHETIPYIDQNTYCIKCDLDWENAPPEHTMLFLSSDTWKCPKCNIDNDNTFCPECGEKKPEPEETTKICNCGKENDATTKICPSCGTKQ